MGETTHEDGVTTVTMTEASLERSAVYPMIHGESGRRTPSLTVLCLIARAECSAAPRTRLFTSARSLKASGTSQIRRPTLKTDARNGKLRVYAHVLRLDAAEVGEVFASAVDSC